MPRLSVVIPTWNGADLLAGALDSLRRQTFRDVEVIVVDNGSTDGTRELLARRYPEVRLVALDSNRGFAAATNAGLKAAAGEILVCMNNDVVAEPSWLAELAAALDARPEVGSVACKMMDAKRPGVLDAAGDAMSLVAWNIGRGEQDAPRFNVPREIISACAGACAYRRAVFDTVGYFDERYFAWFEDVDLGLRAQIAGFRCWYQPTAVVHHLGSATAAKMSDRKAFYTLRNGMMLFFKTMPARRIALWGWMVLAWPWADPFFAAGRPVRVVAPAWFAFWKELPAILRERREIYARRRVSASYLIGLMESPREDLKRAWRNTVRRVRAMVKGAEQAA